MKLTVPFILYHSLTKSFFSSKRFGLLQIKYFSMIVLERALASLDAMLFPAQKRIAWLKSDLAISWDIWAHFTTRNTTYSLPGTVWVSGMHLDSLAWTLWCFLQQILQAHWEVSGWHKECGELVATQPHSVLWGFPHFQDKPKPDLIGNLLTLNNSNCYFIIVFRLI